MPDLPEPTISDEAIGAVAMLVYADLHAFLSNDQQTQIFDVIAGLQAERNALRALVATQQEMLDNYHLQLERLKNAR